MSKIPLLVTALIWLFLLPAWMGQSLRAENLPAIEKRKIEALIERVSELKDARFVRNGSSYSAGNAATFLGRKWQANGSNVKNARDFIDKIASFSGTSGKPYLIRFNDGREISSRKFLLAELRKVETLTAERQASDG